MGRRPFLRNARFCPLFGESLAKNRRPPVMKLRSAGFLVTDDVTVSPPFQKEGQAKDG